MPTEVAGQIKRGSGPEESGKLIISARCPCQKMRYVLTMVETYSGDLLAIQTSKAEQDHTFHGLQQLMAVYCTLCAIQSDNGSHFAYIKVQLWADNGVQWTFHIPLLPASSKVGGVYEWPTKGADTFANSLPQAQRMGPREPLEPTTRGRGTLMS